MRTGRVVWGLDEHENFRIGQVTMINQDSLEVKTLQGDIVSLPPGRAHKVRDNQLYDYVFETIGVPLGEISVPAPAKQAEVPAE